MRLGLTCRTWALASPGQSPGPRSPGPQVPGFRPASRPCTGRDLAVAPGAPTLSRVRPCAPSPARLPLRPQTQPPLSTSRAWRGHRFGRWAGAGAATRGLGSEGSASHSRGAGRAQKRHLQTSQAWRALPCGLASGEPPAPTPVDAGRTRQKAVLSLGKHPRNVAGAGRCCGTSLKAAADPPESRQVGVQGDMWCDPGGGVGRRRPQHPTTPPEALGFRFSLSCLRVVVTAVRRVPDRLG